jgi:hypothetical protein
MIEQAPRGVTWIKVDKPAFDLIGLILRSLWATTILALGALVLGVLLGLHLIRRRRRERDKPGTHLTHLDLPNPRQSNESSVPH